MLESCSPGLGGSLDAALDKARSAIKESRKSPGCFIRNRGPAPACWIVTKIIVQERQQVKLRRKGTAVRVFAYQSPA